MCLGIPMRVIESNGLTALCEGRGVRRNVNVMLVDEAAPGTWLLIHINNAVRVLEEQEAAEIGGALDMLEAALDGRPREDAVPGAGR